MNCPAPNSTASPRRCALFRRPHESPSPIFAHGLRHGRGHAAYIGEDFALDELGRSGDGPLSKVRLKDEGGGGGTDGKLGSSGGQGRDGDVVAPRRRLQAGPGAADPGDGDKGASSGGVLNAFKGVLAKVKRVVVLQAKFTGPGLMASIAYEDPGNWVTDVQAGSTYGYKLLFVVLLAGLFAIVLQTLACRLGCVTGLDIAQHTRRLFYDRPKNKRFWRYGVLWPLYVVTELAVVATDLAEVLGSAIAFNLLIPAMPLWAGVLVTSLDVFIILFAYRPESGQLALRSFEIFIAFLVLSVLGVFVVLLVKVEPNWGDTFDGFLPSQTVVGSQALYLSTGILGATVMPHGIVLGSHFGTLNRLSDPERTVANVTGALESYTDGTPHRSLWKARLAKWFPFLSMLGCRRASATDDMESSRGYGSKHKMTASGRDKDDVETGLGLATVEGEAETLATTAAPERPLPPVCLTRSVSSPAVVTPGGYVDPSVSQDNDDNRSNAGVDISFVRSHLPYASFDIAASLFLFAITINSAILIVASAAFYYGPEEARGTADLFEAHQLIGSYLGSGAALLFALGLLACGQSASITATLAGQLVSEGYIRWRTSPFLRRLFTRLLVIIPALVVAVAVGRKGLDEMLVASQVCLSMALPFVVGPLCYVTGRKAIMKVWDPQSPEAGKFESEKSRSKASVGGENEMEGTQLAFVASSSSTGPVAVMPPVSRCASAPVSAPCTSDVLSPSQSTPPTPASATAIITPPEDLAHSPTPVPPEPAEREAATPPTQEEASGEGEQGRGRWVYFASPWPISLLAWSIFALTCVVNAFVIVTQLGPVDARLLASAIVELWRPHEDVKGGSAMYTTAEQTKGLLFNFQANLTVAAADHLQKTPLASLWSSLVICPLIPGWDVNGDSEKVASIAKRLLGMSNVVQVGSTGNVPGARRKLGVKPDVAISGQDQSDAPLVYSVHRHDSSDGSDYFFNERNATTVDLEFAVTGTPHAYDAWTGDTRKLAQFAASNNSTTVSGVQLQSQTTDAELEMLRIHFISADQTRRVRASEEASQFQL